MKAIILMFDSLNRHMIPPYGDAVTKAPSFERLSRQAVTFDKAYAGSLPCMPARRELHTGRLNFLHRSWSPLEPFDDSMPEILKKNGIHAHLVTDHYHYFENGGATYHTRYNDWEFVRGQEGDPWKGSVKDPFIPPVVNGRDNCLWRQDWVNRPFMQGLDKHPQKLTVDLGLDFIDQNKDSDGWLLQIEAFDPHEPFFVPEDFDKLYEDDWRGPHFDWPNYAEVSESPEAIKHLVLKYRALVSMCDWSLSRVLDKMDELGLWDDTLLIVNTDHGFLLGEHDWWAKCRMPFWEEVSHIPLFIHDPRCPEADGQRRGSLVQTIDIAATILSYFGIPLLKDMEGKDLLPVIREDMKIHDAVLFGIHGGHVNVTDGHHVYMRAPKDSGNSPLYNYTLMPMHMREVFSLEELHGMKAHPGFSFTKGCQVWQVPSHGIPELEFDAHSFGNLLYDIDKDPRQEHPLDDPGLEDRMIDLMLDLMEQDDAPAEQYERLGLARKAKE